MEANLISKLIDVSPVLAVCAITLWYIGKRLFQTQDAHLASQRDRINALERSALECEKDRRELHQGQVDLQKEVIEKLTTIVADKK